MAEGALSAGVFSQATRQPVVLSEIRSGTGRIDLVPEE